MADDVKLMAREEFNASVKAWSRSIKDKSLSVLVSETKSYSGRLQSRLKDILGLDCSTEEAESVAFKFMRYGVFVAYGVGRGSISVNGTVIRGHKLKAGSAGSEMLSRRGMTKRELSREIS